MLEANTRGGANLLGRLGPVRIDFARNNLLPRREICTGRFRISCSAPAERDCRKAHCQAQDCPGFSHSY